MTARHRARALLLGGVVIAVATVAWLFGPQPRFDFRIEAAPGDPSTFIVRAKALNPRAKFWLYTRQELEKSGASYLKVYANGAFDAPLFGTYERLKDELRFRPAIPPVPGSSIAATFPGGQGKAEYEVPDGGLDRSAPQILSIHPSAAILPENMIKFYLEFSAPMAQGDFFQHVDLLREKTSQSVPGAFREVELWSPDGKRFTLWLHPGRQKTGVNLNENEGSVLRQGERYTLQIRDTLTSRAGVRMKKAALKSFTVGPHDGSIPDFKAWHLTSPSKNSLTPLMLVFDKPMDWAMLASGLWIVDAKGDRVKGVSANGDQERQWRFTPAAPWQPGIYTLNANPELEDWAGNSLVRPFESDLSVSKNSPSSPIIHLSFEVSP